MYNYNRSFLHRFASMTRDAYWSAIGLTLIYRYLNDEFIFWQRVYKRHWIIFTLLLIGFAGHLLPKQTPIRYTGPNMNSAIAHHPAPQH